MEALPLYAVLRVPSPKAKIIACRFCGWQFPRWRRKVHVDDAPISGMADVIAHELQAHYSECVGESR